VFIIKGFYPVYFRNQGNYVCDVKLRREAPSTEELNQTKQYLLDIAKEVLMNKKVDHLYPFELFDIAKRKKKFAELELFQSISELYDEKWIVPGERVTKDKVLEILGHLKVYNYINEHLGCDTLDIMIGLRINFRWALKNLETLFKFGFIRARVYSQYYLYYPSESPEELDLVYRLSRNIITRRIMKYFAERNTAITVAELTQALEIEEGTIVRKLNRLVQADIISQIPDEIPLQYEIKLSDPERFREALESYKEF